MVIAVRAALGVLGLLSSESPLLELAANSLTAAAGRRSLAATGETRGQLIGEVSGNTGSGLGVDGEGLPVDVVEGVASQVVAWIGGFASARKDT